MPDWTNSSVLAFAGGADPLEVLSDRAKSTVITALESGWVGPPFDPFELARLRGIPCRATESVTDARIVTRGGRLVIEYNPNRPRRRVRFSIAHEVGHTLFPDCAEVARNRPGTRVAPGDDWQLELLCNLAASEFLMPTGDRFGPEVQPSIEGLLRLQEEFDVSMEAIAIRLVHMTRTPCTLVVAAKTNEAESAAAYRVDYSLPSRTSSVQVHRGATLDWRVLSQCTAVGFTATGTARVGGSFKPTRIECVGIPPYRESSLPRVLCLVHSSLSEEAVTAGLNQLRGDALEFREAGPIILAHLVNDRATAWGGDFARAVRGRFPTAQEEFRRWSGASRGRASLGHVHVVEVEKDRYVASMVAQHGYGPSPKPRIRYSALRDCLRLVAEAAIEHRASVQMPRIGTGMAGGNWSFIRELIDEELVCHGIPVTVVGLPRAKAAPRNKLGGANHRLDEAFPMAGTG